MSANIFFAILELHQRDIRKKLIFSLDLVKEVFQSSFFVDKKPGISPLGQVDTYSDCF